MWILDFFVWKKSCIIAVEAFAKYFLKKEYDSVKGDYEDGLNYFVFKILRDNKNDKNKVYLSNNLNEYYFRTNNPIIINNIEQQTYNFTNEDEDLLKIYHKMEIDEIKKELTELGLYLIETNSVDELIEYLYTDRKSVV